MSEAEPANGGTAEATENSDQSIQHTAALSIEPLTLAECATEIADTACLPTIQHSEEQASREFIAEAAGLSSPCDKPLSTSPAEGLAGEACKEQAVHKDLSRQTKQQRNKKHDEGNKPPPFVELKRNAYVSRSEDDCCSEDQCLNALVATECTPGYCPVEETCQNQRFQRREYINTQLVETPGRGWGLIAEQDVQLGQFVIEYCGEVISEKEAQQRSKLYESQGIRHHYFMVLGGTDVIDATRKGCLASNPNCETRKWHVLGELRVGIFGKHFIPTGTELTYNYNFQYFGGAKTKCCCGATNCVGFLGANSRTFKEASYLWDDEDDRYGINNNPLYDSGEDDAPPLPAAVLAALVPRDTQSPSVKKKRSKLPKRAKEMLLHKRLNQAPSGQLSHQEEGGFPSQADVLDTVAQQQEAGATSTSEEAMRRAMMQAPPQRKAAVRALSAGKKQLEAVKRKRVAQVVAHELEAAGLQPAAAEAAKAPSSWSRKKRKRTKAVIAMEKRVAALSSAVGLDSTMSPESWLRREVDRIKGTVDVFLQAVGFCTTDGPDLQIRGGSCIVKCIRNAYAPAAAAVVPLEPVQESLGLAEQNLSLCDVQQLVS
eukprot:jgi/Chlat1/6297/Chrsp44S05872